MKKVKQILLGTLIACSLVTAIGVTAYAKPKASQSSKPIKKGKKTDKYSQLGQKKAKELTKKLKKTDKFLESLVPKEYRGNR